MAALDLIAAAYDPETGARGEAAMLEGAYGHLEARELIAVASSEVWPGRVGVVSSFGAESAVLLHLVASVDRSLPVVFIDTGRLFAETLEHRNRLTEILGLTDVRTVSPDPDRLAAADPHRALWMTDPDLCCRIRKTEPLARAVKDFDAWFTGRKRFQSNTRSSLPVFEAEGTRVKVNPLVRWSAADLEAYAHRFDLPAHPLVARGYPSIGCVPCTTTVKAGEDQRAGRWRGLDKTECGIHLGLEADGSGI